jgi:hypothetical protein
VFNLTSVGADDVFVSKLDSSGNFVWARAMGGTGGDVGRAVAVDATGNVYTTGSFQGTADFNPGPGVFNLTSVGGDDVFVSKLDSAGNFLWARAMGGTGSVFTDRGTGVAVDAAGHVYTTGTFTGMVDFDPGPGVFNLTSVGGHDVFVSKLDSAGNFLWARAMGGIASDEGKGVVVDGSGNAYITGNFQDTADFDPGPGVFSLTSAGNNDVFVSKLDSAGSFVWAGAMGGGSSDVGFGVAVDAAGNVYTTGWFSVTADFDPGPGAFNLTSAGFEDVFVSKLDSAGNFVWARAMGSAGSFELGAGVAVDGAGNVYTTGPFDGTVDFDPGPGVFNLTSAGGRVFVSKLDSAGSFVWAGAMGGGNSSAGGVAVDAAGNVYTTGGFAGTADFDPGPGVFNLSSAGTNDVFVSAVGACAMGQADTVGLVDPRAGRWLLCNTAGVGTQFFFGDPGDLPIAGDWNNNGTDTPGLYRQSDGFFYARNSNTQGTADFACFAGNPGDVPVAGDWDGDGDDTVGIYRPSIQTFYLFNITCTGSPMGEAQVSFLFGNPGDLPYAGDFDGDGLTEVGLFRPSTGFVYYRDTLTFGNATNSFFWGNPADRVFSGDWDGNGTSTPGLFRPSSATMFLRNSNTQGNADISFPFGEAPSLPVSGAWGLG